MRRLLMKTGWCVLFFFALLNCILDVYKRQILVNLTRQDLTQV